METMLTVKDLYVPCNEFIKSVIKTEDYGLSLMFKRLYNDNEDFRNIFNGKYVLRYPYSESWLIANFREALEYDGIEKEAMRNEINGMFKAYTPETVFDIDDTGEIGVVDLAIPTNMYNYTFEYFINRRLLNHMNTTITSMFYDSFKDCPVLIDSESHIAYPFIKGTNVEITSSSNTFTYLRISYYGVDTKQFSDYEYYPWFIDSPVINISVKNTDSVRDFLISNNIKTYNPVKHSSYSDELLRRSRKNSEEEEK